MHRAPGEEVRRLRAPWRWFLEESFWRDVTTRTIAGLLVVTLTFLVGRAAGYFQGPSGERVVGAAVSVGLLLSCIPVLSGAVFCITWREWGLNQWRTRVFLVLVALIACALVYLGQRRLGWVP